MAIKVITGKPGSGKTYYAVHHLYTQYCDKDSCRLSDSEVTIITNIDSLQLPHLSLDHCLKESNQSIQTFFTVPFQEKISKKYKKIVYFIDEAQQYFDSKFYNKEVFYYFQTHRHLGHDIYLITQAYKLLPYNINQLAEREIRAQPRSVSIMGEFKYYVYVSGESIDRFALKKKEVIFDLYKSMSAKEHEKINNPFLKYLALLGVFMVAAGFLFYHTFIKKITTHKNEKKKETTQLLQPKKAYAATPTNSKNNQEPKRQTKNRIILNYIIIDNKTFYYDPEINLMLPISEFPYPFQIVKSQKSVKIIASVPDDIYQIYFDAQTRQKGSPALSAEPPPINMNYQEQQ